MPAIVDLREDIKRYIQRHGISKKWERVKRLFEDDPSHPSLNTELLEPKHRFIYSFSKEKGTGYFLVERSWERLKLAD